MGARTDQIEQHIGLKRAELGSDLQALETRMKRVTDWRYQFARHPFAILLGAFGGGALIGTLSRQPKRSIARSVIQSPAAWKIAARILTALVFSRRRA